jgi:predicted dehydrogenase
MLRIGIIGAGFGRWVHLPAFLALPEVRVMGIAAATPEKTHQIAQEHRLPYTFENWQEVIACPQVDAISLATPPVQNEAIVKAAFAAKKPVLCEKPLAGSVEQALRMYQMALRSGLPHMVDFEFRAIPAWRLTHELLHQQHIGRLRHVAIHWIMEHWADVARSSSWKTDSAQGGGILNSLAVHVFDYVAWFLAPIQAVTAQLTNRISQRPGQSPSNAEDCVHLLLTLTDGTPVSVTISAIARAGRGHHVEFYGENGTLILKNENVQDFAAGFGLWENKGTGWQIRPIPERLQFAGGAAFADGRIPPVLEIARRFVAAVQDASTAFEPSFEQGLNAQLVLEAARQAQQERRWVDVPELKTLMGV